MGGSSTYEHFLAVGPDSSISSVSGMHAPFYSDIFDVASLCPPAFVSHAADYSAPSVNQETNLSTFATKYSKSKRRRVGRLEKLRKI